MSSAYFDNGELYVRYVLKWGSGAGAMTTWGFQRYSTEAEVQAVVVEYPEILDIIADGVEGKLDPGPDGERVDSRPMFELAKKR